jgi:hypothetical protein
MSTAVAYPQADIQPQQGETYAQYVQRAHYALMADCPDWMERNDRVWSNWEASRGDNLRQRAKQYFSSNRFVPNVCYFSEHETIGRDGRPVRYSFHELSEIVEEHNSRADRHNYSALASKHTVDGVLPENLEPKVVGYVGSARLGMVGNENPQWAAFFDEHHKTDKYSTDVLADKQRRSVEVNRYKDGRRPYFDPVAVLGADSPRLPLPVARYAEDGAMIDRYSVMAPAQVSGSNSFIPSFGSDNTKPRQQQQYSEQPTMGSNLTPQDIQAVVQAIQSTPEMEWVRNQMGTGGPASAGGGGNGPQQAAPGGAPSMPPPQPQQGQQYMGHQQPQLPRYSASDDDDLKLTEKYSQVESELADLKERYSKLNEVNADLMRQHSQTRQAVIELEKHNCDKDREMQIKDLYQKYPHFVQVDEELDRCLYSRGSTLDTDQFTAHLSSVERYAQRSSPVTGMVPKGTLANPVADKERYEAQVADMIVDRYHRYEKQGEYRTYDQLEAEIRKELQAGSVA